MAGMRPFFLTGANAKIKVNNITLAYCTNLSYSIIVNHASPKVLGMFEPTSIEPLGYSVTGSFTVVRYVADATNEIEGSVPNGVNAKGNGIGAWGPTGTLNRLVKGLNPSHADGRIYDNLNPGKLEKATGFEIDIYQKIGTNAGLMSVARIREARITKADFSLNKGSAATQVFQFTALYVDEDSFLADFSGQGQQFS
ncbi:hypothetical protein UFOVP53_217 [uncultured Caudovirales phage]|uniref:Tail tube protein n=1 Tax=uncultured Caudovirales phage TaxID=2100421 RepID=A0A6J5KT94_9CAUD|nr:hypothetical protein UFOVP53_217 [uncultured Caudovirales phage]